MIVKPRVLAFLFVIALFQPSAFSQSGSGASVLSGKEIRKILVQRIAGRHLIDPGSPLLPAESTLLQQSKERKEITADPKLLDLYAGRYQLTPALMVTVTREGNSLFAQLTGQQKFEIFAETDRNWFFKVVDAQIVFEVDNQGRAAALSLHQMGLILKATRNDGQPQQIWFGRKETTVDPGVFENYTGRYQLGNSVVTVIREGNGLFVEIAGQPRNQIFPETARNYFSKSVDAAFSFEIGSQGKAVALAINQNGRTLRAQRIE